MTQARPTRILMVTRNLPPLVGGMERLNWHMADELSKAAEIRVIGPEGSATLAPGGIDVCEAPLKPLWKFLLRARALARREARQWKPDVVLAGSGLTAPIARAAARACGAKIAVYVHGLDVAVKHPVYRALWLPAIRGADRVIANSRATARLCSDIGVQADRIGIVHPGVDLPDESAPGPQNGSGEGTRAQAAAREDVLSSTTHSSVVIPGRPAGPNPESSFLQPRAAEFRAQHNLGSGPILLSVGRLSARKGLREFVVGALPRIVAAHPDAVLLIVGDAPSQALHAEAQTPASIQTAAEAAGVGGHVRFFGKLPEAELLDAYQSADLHVFPIRHIPGDPEGFGMVAVEAAAHGLPTIAFATGGVIDAVAEGVSGYLVEPGDYAAFADTVITALDQREALRAPCIEFALQFAWPEFGAQIVRQLGLA
ncbi:MAG: glycosyltransferase family 1 protein [Rhodanobacteraceae bacterium]|nr:MAG: glycosyltransferase family 1 protein [Rhodanobacteraceae bacterium]